MVGDELQVAHPTKLGIHQLAVQHRGVHFAHMHPPEMYINILSHILGKTSDSLKYSVKQRRHTRIRYLIFRFVQHSRLSYANIPAAQSYKLHIAKSSLIAASKKRDRVIMMIPFGPLNCGVSSKFLSTHVYIKVQRPNIEPKVYHHTSNACKSSELNLNQS